MGSSERTGARLPLSPQGEPDPQEDCRVSLREWGQWTLARSAGKSLSLDGSRRYTKQAVVPDPEGE